MEILLKVIHILASVFLVLVVLLQSGRGGGMGAAFGGASGQIFGGRGASTFLSRVTSGAAVVFFMTSLTLSMLSSRHRSVVLDAAKPARSAPADAGGEATGKAADANGAEAPAAGTNDAADAIKKAAPAEGEPAKKPDGACDNPARRA